MNIKTLPADDLRVGSCFIPAGKKFPVEVIMIEEQPGFLLVGCYLKGFTVVRVSRYDTVQAVIPERAA